MTPNVSAQSVTVREMGPMVSVDQLAPSTPARLTRPHVGRMPTRPLLAAGPRIEPPVSSPRDVAHRNPAVADAAAGAGRARVPVGIPRIAGRPEPTADRIAHGELAHVGLADDHRPGVLELGHHRRVSIRHEVRPDLRRVGGAYAGGVDLVLHSHRDGRAAAPGSYRPAASSSNCLFASARASSAHTVM